MLVRIIRGSEGEGGGLRGSNRIFLGGLSEGDNEKFFPGVEHLQSKRSHLTPVSGIFE